MSPLAKSLLLVGNGFVLGVAVVMFDSLFEGMCVPPNLPSWRVAMMTALLFWTIGSTYFAVRFASRTVGQPSP